jgi:hypothetical protein
MRFYAFLLLVSAAIASRNQTIAKGKKGKEKKGA